MSTSFEQDLLNAAAVSRGHFRYESGHHGDVWLELDKLFVDARRMQNWVSALAGPSVSCNADIVCGPLMGGAFVAQLLAAETGSDFVFAERIVNAVGQVQYRTPESLRAILAGRRVLLVDDAVNAGSALLATLADVLACGAELAGFASLLTLGEAAAQISGRHGVPFITLASLQRRIWLPGECPLCAAGIALVDPFAHAGEVHFS